MDRRPAGLASGILLLLVALAGFGCGGSPTKAHAASSGPSEKALVSTAAAGPADVAAEAYVWGSPLVVSMRTAREFAQLFGVNHLYNEQQLSDPGIRIIVAPNVDTLYSVALLDLREGPLVLTVPAIHDRYYCYEFLDTYTEAFAYIGTRATKGVAGSWLVVPPGWTGPVPAGDHVVRSSTPVLFLLGRFLVSGADDLPAARAVMAQVKLAPMQTAGVTPAPTLPAWGTANGSPQDVPAAGAAFFDELGEALAVSPPSSPTDRAALARFAALGIGPGSQPAARCTAAQCAALARGVVKGQARVRSFIYTSVHDVDGWQQWPQLGDYGGDFLLRAAVAQTVWGANVPEEAVYLRSLRDADGARYTGRHAYVLHFAAGGLPPAKAFWSLTVYDADGFLVENPIHRYAIGDRTPGLEVNRNGSLDLYLSHDSPKGHGANWLPVPAGSFTLILRIYLPARAVIDGTYRAPAVDELG